ncbi:hypothetical protein D915_002643 [Fasciola hepatica]|uniref:Uncharacterized protein n=1 Tax=Fasciola hepatica TaxID=6192 RepID=A0A4E0S2W1_FASHE|nr:hypothetical protein D915_002643 [Fasciola hepatica]
MQHIPNRLVIELSRCGVYFAPPRCKMPLEDCQEPSLECLGSIRLPSSQAKDEVILWINNAREAFLQLRRAFWTCSEISLRTEVRIYRATMRPVLRCGCEPGHREPRILEVGGFGSLVPTTYFENKLARQSIQR